MLRESSSTGSLPISHDHALQELRHSGGADGTLILRHTESAIRYVEREAQITLRPAVVRVLDLPNWPTYNGDGSSRYGESFGNRRGNPDKYQVESPIRLPRPPLASVDSVKYYDTDNTLQTVTSTNYHVIGSDTASALLEFDDNYTFPSLRARVDAVEITFTTGSANPDSVGISAALLMLHFFVDHDRDAKTEADKLISSLRLHSYGA